MVGVNIGFYTPQLCLRGTTVAVFNYAKYNQELLGNKSYIFYDKNHCWTDKGVEEKFKKEFDNVIELDKFEDVDFYIEKFDIKVLFNEKAGNNDGKLSKIAKNVIHCVFVCNEPHGDIYCSISNWVLHNNGRYPVIPYITYLPEHNEDMRSELNIPHNATVYGRHGGREQFDIFYAKEAVYEFALRNPDVYFIFVFTDKFCPDLNNIIHLDNIVDLHLKRKFINTCDAMIWARNQGESFGLAIAEFSISNKPVIASPVGDAAHINILGDKGLWYKNKEELLNIFDNFDRLDAKTKDWNCYRQYCPEIGIKIFEEIAIKSVLQ